MLLERIQADDFRGESDLAIAGLRPGVNAILLPDWNSSDELRQRIFDAFVGETSELSDTVFFVKDGLGDAIMSADEIATLLSDFDIALFETFYHDNVRPDEIGRLVCESDLADLFTIESVETVAVPNASSRVRERIGFRNEVLQETLLSAKRKYDVSRQQLTATHHSQYATLTKKRESLLRAVGSTRDEIRRFDSEIAPLKLANEVSDLWRRRESIQSRSEDTRSLNDLIAIAQDVESFDVQIAEVRDQVSAAKRKIRNRKKAIDNVVSSKTPRLHAIRELLADSERARTAEQECKHLRRLIQDQVSVVHETSSPNVESRQVPRPCRSPHRILQILAPFADRVRMARERLRDAHQHLNSRKLQPAENEVCDEAAAEIAELSEQVEVLNEACEQIRGRQSLPPGAIGGILAVFVSGLALVGFGMVLDLGGHEWLAIGIGILAMISVGMLKISLERAPLVQLRILRHEVTALLERIAALSLHSDEKIMASIDPTVSVEVADQQLAIALHNWREALVAHGFPESLSPNQLAKQLRALEPLGDGFDELGDQFDESCEDLFVDSPMSGELDLRHLSESPEFEHESASPVFDSERLSELRDALEVESQILTRWRDAAAIELRTAADSLNDLPIASIADELRDTLRRLESSIQDADASDGYESSEKELQTVLKKLKRERRHRIAETGVETLVELKELIRTERKRSGNKAKIAELTSKIDETLSNSDAGSDARKLLTELVPKQLAAKLAESQSAKSNAEQTLIEQQQRLSQMAQQINDLIDDRESDSKRLESAEATARIKKATQDLVSNLIVHEILESRDGLAEVPRSNELLAAATDYFRQSTPWKESEIRFDDQLQQFYIEQVGQFSKSLSDLDEEFAVQATLCIQLALFEHFRVAGFVAPVLLGDQWTHPTRRFAAETIQLLNNCGKNGHQFFATTWDEATAEFYNACGQPVLVVDRETDYVSREEPIATSEIA